LGFVPPAALVRKTAFAPRLLSRKRGCDGFPAHAFVVVAAALEDEGFDAGGLAPDEAAGVAGDAGLARPGIFS
jgi:hypothetical protein